MSSFVGVNDDSPNEDEMVEGWLDKYVVWMKKEPLKARCITYAMIGAVGAALGARQLPKGRQRQGKIDWLEVVSFALHGGLMAGPLSHSLSSFLEEQFEESRSKAVMFDQVIAQPVQLFFMFIFLEVSRSAVSSIPRAVRQSSSLLGGVVADSLKFWPLSIYILLKTVKRRKHYVAALNMFSIAWAAHVAKRRSRQSA